MGNYSFQDLMSFGMFLLALLTFIVLINRKQPIKQKSYPNFAGRGSFLYTLRHPTLVGGCLSIYIITRLNYFSRNNFYDLLQSEPKYEISRSTAALTIFSRFLIHLGFVVLPISICRLVRRSQRIDFGVRMVAAAQKNLSLLPY